MKRLESSVGLRTMGAILAVCCWCAAARAQSLAWVPLGSDGPSARASLAMAYDVDRGLSVIFGGVTALTPYTHSGETWEWGSGAWTLRATTGPSGRSDHAMAYDSFRHETVLFGGQYGPTEIDTDETWVWNGTSWTQRMVSGPSAREGHRMVYDSARHVIVLFGGWNPDGSLNGETWEWNGSAWTLRAVSGPAPRAQPAMAYDSVRGVTVLFGGTIIRSPSPRADPANGETWEWSGSAWTQRQVAGPSIRQAHAMVFDAARGVTVLFGGINLNTPNAETWEWNGTAWAQRALSGPGPRMGHCCAYDSARGLTLMFGGWDTVVGNAETWTLARAPAAAVVSSAVVGSTALRVTVRYTDDLAVNLNAVDGNDVELRRTGGATIAAALVSRVVGPANVVTAVYDFAGPGGAWDSTDNGAYSLWQRVNQVGDNAGLFADAQSLTSYNLWFNDPSATVISEGIDPLSAFMDATVYYRDAAGNPIGISWGSVGDGDVELAGPLGYLAQGSLRSRTVPQTGELLATYRFSALGGYWDWTDNGAYTLRVRANQVWDAQGYPVAAFNLRTYNLFFETPNAAEVSTSVAAGGTSMLVTVNYRARNRLMSWASLGTGDVELRGPGGYLGVGTLVSRGYAATTNTYTVTYQIPARGGVWDSADNGSYSLWTRAGEVVDSAGYAVPAAQLRSYGLWF